jgi:hypothetical protein
MFCKYFLPVCSLSFHSFPGISQRAEVLNFDENQPFIFFFWLMFFMSYIRSICVGEAGLGRRKDKTLCTKRAGCKCPGSPGNRSQGEDELGCGRCSWKITDTDEEIIFTG